MTTARTTVNTARQPGEGLPRSMKSVLGILAAAVAGRTLFYAAVDAFIFYVFGDPRTEGAGSGPPRGISAGDARVVEDHRPPRTADSRLSEPQAA